MPFVAECPSCGQKLKVPDNLAGKKVRCSKCANTFVAESASEGPPAAPPPPPPSEAVRPSRRREEEPPPQEEEYEDRPRRRRSRRDDDGEGGGGGGRPGRGGMLLTFGIISCAGPVLAMVFSVLGGMVFAPLGICSLIFIIVGLVLGIMAWVMGKGDLKKIRAGEIDSAAQGQTKGGYITGIIGTILNVLYIACGCIGAILMLIFGAAALGLGAAAASQQKNQPFNVPKRTFQLPLPKLSQYLPERVAMAMEP
jgi:predicted Zn finger-like uncharacterized protein